jgi:hypothetical protein
LQADRAVVRSEAGGDGHARQTGEIDPNTAHNTRRRRLGLTSSAKG